MVLKELKRKVVELYLTIRYYSFIPKKVLNEKPVIIIMFDGSMGHGGLLDRIKGIISTSMIAEQLNYDWKVYCDVKTFNLFKFLNTIDTSCVATKEEVIRNAWVSKPVLFYNVFNQSRPQVLSLFKKGKTQYHFYCNVDLSKLFIAETSIEELNNKWRKSFFSIFRFDNSFNEVQKQLFNTLENTCGIHLRFQSLLGDSNEGVDKTLQDEECKLLLLKCINHTVKLIDEGNFKQYLVVSDSTNFLNHLKDTISKESRQENIQVLGGSIGHIDVNHSEEVLQKAILDFYLLTKCKTIYQVLGKGMYNSQFSKYAAIVGKADYVIERI